jgi:DNA replicative helicase MCM subunit Mcm2 (Cdc46/Mcm family)
MKKDAMLERVIEMAQKLAKLELQEQINKVEAENKEMLIRLQDLYVKDESQRNKMVELTDERNKWKTKAEKLEKELNCL